MLQVIEVLIVEDDFRIADIHHRFTEKIEGFRVVGTAATGEQAKEWIKLLRPQLILLDVYLPDMRGIELVRYVRGHFPDIDIIMITAASEADIVRHALRGGVFDYIVKPLTFDRFEKSLKNYASQLEKLQQEKELSLEQIESMWNIGKQIFEKQQDCAPKGIDPLTLDKILKCTSTIGGYGVTAEELSKRSGVSRSTARRYLEYLISQKKVRADLIYGSVGRPERRYFQVQS
ncbi:response regulator [Ectobacillus sp. JY-23]|uniref:response regulator n=1 Tax=Ectobacillus sp. JY-23 TaxID=2933872 RepID=UPI001FF13B6F|nr:response regulator [Ectobacillus sp. JY-23]UOY91754.1 response regulator [Ectobacillus sp. JY-23]